MGNPNITIEEYIRLQEEKALSRYETFNWQTATYGKMEHYEDEDDCFTNFESESPTIVLDDASREALSWEPMPEVRYSNDLDFFKDFENEFPTIVYNDALTSKSDFLTEPVESPQHINEFNLKNETSLSECDEKEQNVLYFNDLFPFNVIYPNDLKSDTDNDNDIIDIEQPSGDMSVIQLPNGINVDTQGSNKLLETRTIWRILGFGIRRIDPCTVDLAETMIWGVSPAVAADAPPIATPRRRLRGHERGGLDDDGGVVTMACKAGDDGGSVVIVRDSPEVASSE
ncbi:hypothetical protein Tco_0651746 [Tanacetum coccineum]|uniref:Uncharacterized protein n=1 Tax=Tanacetum coccineum TaxID=301880 RepID=A0ABQ4WVT1_9ASTR